jgi:hypothetical protein
VLPSAFTDIPPRELSSTFGFYPVRGPPRHRREKYDTLVAMKSSIEYKGRGALVGRTTQRWVEATGRRVALEECSWLEGPVGDVDVIGGDLKTSVSTSIHEATCAPITIARSGARHFSGCTIESHRNPET